MPQSPDLSKYLDAGVEFVAMTRSQARARAKELVAQGHLAQNQVQAFVDDLVDESRRRTDLVLDVIRQEIQRQVKTLGIATKADLSRLESKMATTTKAATSKAVKSAAKAPAKTPTARKSTKAPAAKKSTKATAAKKSTKATAAKKPAAKRTAAPRAARAS